VLSANCSLIFFSGCNIKGGERTEVNTGGATDEKTTTGMTDTNQNEILVLIHNRIPQHLEIQISIAENSSDIVDKIVSIPGNETKSVESGIVHKGNFSVSIKSEDGIAASKQYEYTSDMVNRGSNILIDIYGVNDIEFGIEE
jgi:hypothetical protein